jgi:radical SAM protein with 4Fe4S-binding SPASM domain
MNVHGYETAPMMAYWEVTQSCGLACRHCRAEAVPYRDPLELSTDEGKRLLDSLAGFGERAPHLVLTGGDPFQRPDIAELVSYATSLGLVVSVTPSATPLVTRSAIVRLKKAGVRSLAFSVDGSNASRHDRIRGIEGTFDRTICATNVALEESVPVQVNTLVSSETAPDLEAVYELVCRLHVQRWAVFFLIATGRGQALTEVTSAQAESILAWLLDVSANPMPIIKTTEAHHYRRLDAIRKDGGRTSAGAWGIRDGAGIMFVSHKGDIYPSGFLPVTTGNVRADDPVEIYRKAPLFRQLRNVGALKGKCGRCEFRVICGGSRARAYAATGDPLESDPLCSYEPKSSA